MLVIAALFGEGYMRSLAFALLTLTLVTGGAFVAVAEVTNAPQQHYGSIFYPDVGLAYPKIGTPIQLGPLQFTSKISTQVRTSVTTYRANEEHLLTTELRGPAAPSGLQFNLKLLVPIKKADVAPPGFFPNRMSSDNPHSLNGRKTKAEASVGFTLPF
jgi:hypothetical protein